MTLTTRPSDSFTTPYQMAVSMLARKVIEYESYHDAEANWINKWAPLNEADCEITVPVLGEDGRWRTTIGSAINEIPPILVSFKTLSVHTYFNTRFQYTKSIYGVGHKVTQPGFYFGLGDEKVILVLRDYQDIEDGIRFQGCELLREYYRVDQQQGKVILSHPVVAGDIPIALLS